MIPAVEDVYITETSFPRMRGGDPRVDETPEDWWNLENYWHAVVIRDATMYKIGYRRVKR